VSDARAKLSAERPVVELSAQGLSQAVDVTSVQGETVSKDVTIMAQVRSPEGATAEQQMVVTLTRGMFTLPSAAEPVAGRWIITKIEKS